VKLLSGGVSDRAYCMVIVKMLTMEGTKPSFEFIRGEISEFNIANAEPGVTALMREIQKILRPTIKKHNLSGKIELTVSEGKARLAYINIMPFEFASVLIELITKSDSGDSFSYN
jgi:hypothetical protein